MHDITLFTAKYMIAIVGLIAVIFWLRLSKKDKIRFLVFGVIVALISLLLLKIGSSLFYDTRPFVLHNVIPIYPHAPDNGFPSDHTILAAFIAVTVYAFSKRLGLSLFVMAILIGLSRVIGNVHNPIDIVGSLAFALVGGLVAYYLTPKIMARFNV